MMSELTDSQIDAIKTDVDPWLEAIEGDSDYFKIKRHIVDLQTRLAAAESTIAGQLATIEALTVGTDGSTPAIVQLARMEERLAALETALRDCLRHMKTAGSPEAVRACEAAEELLGVRR